MSYDSFGNMTVVSIGQNPDNAIVLATYDYGEQNGHLNSMTYGNGDSITYHYDNLDRLTEEAWGDGTSYEYFYNSEGALTKKVDTATGNTVNYEYAGTYATNFAEFTLTYEYDDLGNIETITNSANPSDNRAYSYDIQGQLLSETFGTDGNRTTNSYTYDTYGNIRKAVKDGVEFEYEYGNTDWKDLLTAYDGGSIIYEAITTP